MTVISSHEEAENLAFPEGEKLCVVSQTTFNYNKFQELVEIFEKKRYDKVVLNTICSATEERQTEARETQEAWSAHPLYPNDENQLRQQAETKREDEAVFLV